MDLLKNKYFTWLGVATLAMLFLFLGSATIHQLKETDTSSIDSRNTITVSGTGEAVAIPDIATFSFSVTKEAKTSAEAQKLTTDISNKILDAVKKDGVAEKDIKTTNYSLYPKYDYPQVVCPAIYPSNCPSGKEVLRGYEVSQTFDVKIRDVAKAGQIVGDATTAGATNINGPTFGVDKEDDVIAQARNEAIDNAKAKAKLIAKGLGVRLVKIVAFNENENSYGLPMMNKSVMGLGGADAVSAPQLPTGENKYSRTVQITYEIR
ncbi:MAG: SIMPL domain-containing protein [archaeon]